MTTTHASELSKLQQFVHDIRSPLLSLEILAKRTAPKLEPDQRRLMGNIVDRLRSMADEAVGDGPSSAFAVHSPAAIVDRVVAAKWLELDSRPGLTLECRFGAQARDARIAVHAATLERVLSNLINNSFEAIEGDGRVIVSVSATSSRVLILIEDTGMGFSSSALASLQAMQRWKTVSPLSSTKHLGEGLGLSHAMREVRALGGMIRFDNNSGNGAAVSLVLPLAR